MVIIRKYEVNHPVVGVADSWEAFESATIKEKKKNHAKKYPEEFGWDKGWEEFYKDSLKKSYFAEEITYWKD